MTMFTLYDHIGYSPDVDKMHEICGSFEEMAVKDTPKRFSCEKGVFLYDTHSRRHYRDRWKQGLSVSKARRRPCNSRTIHKTPDLSEQYRTKFVVESPRQTRAGSVLSGYSKLLVVVLSILSVVAVSGEECPQRCECPSASNKVMCERAGYTDIPSPLPPTSTTLDISDNQLVILSLTALSPLRNIINLTLTNNRISHINDGAFSAMTSLQTLLLGANRLSTLSEHTFSGATALVELNLSDNQLTTAEGAFAGMGALTKLDLSGNQLTAISQFTLRDLRSLVHLRLADNKISRIDRRAFRNLSKLVQLVLKGNLLGESSRLHFNSLSLNYLDLSECGLGRVPRGLPSSVRYLLMRRNNMTVVHRNEFQDCPYVSILVLDENQIEEIQEEPFQNMNHLRQLWMNTNRLRTIPTNLPPSLQRLLMDSNQITNLSNVFPVESQLNTLSLMGNNISELTYNALYNTPLLKSLDLSNNRIEHIYGHTFINISKLETLQLSKNPLKFFHSRCFLGLNTLKTLSMAYVVTEVAMHPDSFDHMKSLMQLDLDSSPSIIESVLDSDQLLAGIRGVEELSLQDSGLTHLRSDFATLFPELTLLHISSTRWHCDRSLMWFRDWILSSSVIFRDREYISCRSPRSLRNRPLTSLADADFVQSTTPSQIPTRRSLLDLLTTFPPTKSTKTASTTSTITPTSTAEWEKGSQRVTSDWDDNLPGIDGPFPSLFPPGNANDTKKLNKSEVDNMSQPQQSKTYHPDESSVKVKTLPTNGGNAVSDATATSDSTESSSRTTILIIVATSITTVVVATVLIAIIIHFSRKGRRREPRENGKTNIVAKSPTHNNGVKYNHKKDALYFMPTGAESQKSSSHDSIKTASSKEANMSLIPGRDINHEGPLRVYKWEDF